MSGARKDVTPHDHQSHSVLSGEGLSHTAARSVFFVGVSPQVSQLKVVGSRNAGDAERAEQLHAKGMRKPALSVNSELIAAGLRRVRCQCSVPWHLVGVRHGQHRIGHRGG